MPTPRWVWAGRTLAPIVLLVGLSGPAEAQNTPSPASAPVRPARGIAAIPVAGDGLFAGQPHLALDEFVALVQARNPTVASMVAAWRAAAFRYPQAVALDDPMFMAMAAPASFASSTVDAGYVLQGSQKFPTHGKRQARGRVAQAETTAALAQVDDARLQVVEAAQLAYYEYYLVERQLELNGQNLAATGEFRRAAQARYESNQATEQDVLQADVELTELDRRRIELKRMQRVAQARVNTLLVRSPDDYLPSAPANLPTPRLLPPAQELRSAAVFQRPDLGAIAAQIRAEQASIDLARREYYPDLDAFGRYDSFWQPASTQKDLRGQAGLNMNIPLYKQKRAAAVCEATARLAQRRAEYQQRVADIQFQVESAYQEVLESAETLDLYRQRFVPLATQNVASARANYDVGKASFLNLIEAQRQLIDLRDRQQQALADYHRRLAQLQRVVGAPLDAVK